MRPMWSPAWTESTAGTHRAGANQVEGLVRHRVRARGPELLVSQKCFARLRLGDLSTRVIGPCSAQYAGLDVTTDNAGELCVGTVASLEASDERLRRRPSAHSLTFVSTFVSTYLRSPVYRAKHLGNRIPPVVPQRLEVEALARDRVKTRARRSKRRSLRSTSVQRRARFRKLVDEKAVVASPPSP